MHELDSDFTDLFLRYLVTDRQMLAAVGDLVDPKDFEDKNERIIAGLAVQHWRESQEPISSYLRIELGDYLDRRKSPIQPETKAALLKLVNSILGRERPLIAATKVHKLFRKFKTDQFMRRSMDEVLELQMTGTLDIQQFSRIAQQCAEYTSSTDFQSRDYTATLDTRIKQREQLATMRYPLFYIDPLDEAIRSCGRKELGLFLAPWKSGKSMALIHMVKTLAQQKKNVIHISMEDTQDILDRRLDSMIADLPINQIVELSSELKDRFDRAVRRFRNRIRLVDAVGKNLTVAQMDGIVERERASGFTTDALVIDYDDKIAPASTRHKDKRFEIDETYTDIQNMLGRRDMIGWSAAQVGRKGDRKKIIDGGMVAEDIGKIRKAVVSIGIGFGEQGDKHKHLYITHRDGRSRFGVDIMSNYAHGQFYDREETLRQFQRTAEVEV
jgi:hypothetical protein